MRTFTKLFFALILISIVSSCSSNKHLTGDYDKYANGHRMVAVLPYDIQMMGRKVQNMDPIEVEQMRMIEAKLFQQSLYAEVLKRTGRDKNDIQISVLDMNKTNRLLEDAGINILDIASYTPAELGSVLGVDAVISTRLIKEIFLSKSEALLVDVASTTILDKIPVRVPIFDRSKATRSSEVDIYCTIIDAESESAIWQLQTECDLQWDTDDDDAIELINKRISKKFPYRERNKRRS